MNQFKSYHPLVNFIYFVLVIGFSMVFMHPVCLMISLVCALFHWILLKGKKGFRGLLGFLLPMVLLTALVNPLFNHRGVTVIQYLPDGNPLTLESICYGLSQGVMLVGVIGWFLCFSKVITEDKITYLFGKCMPSLALIFSMTLRFVPHFINEYKKIRDARRCMGLSSEKKGFFHRAREGISLFSVMITKALENSVETADSMKARGYGLPGRTSFSVFRFGKRDFWLLIWILLVGGYTLAGAFLGRFSFQYFPSVTMLTFNTFDVSLFVSYGLLCISPAILELWEVRKWHSLQSNS